MDMDMDQKFQNYPINTGKSGYLYQIIFTIFESLDINRRCVFSR